MLDLFSIICLITCLSLLIWEPSLRLPQERIENQLYMFPICPVFPHESCDQFQIKMNYDLQIFFETSSVMEIVSQLRMTWVDFFSNIGGLLGLVLGMGFISFIEIIWLALRLGAQVFGFKDWIQLQLLMFAISFSVNKI